MSLIPPIPYAKRDDWADVIPVPQNEIENPLVPIFYTDEYRDAADYFRGILRIGEKSPRVLEITEHIIKLNPGHYSAWQYRYETLVAIKADLVKELKLIDGLTEKFMKHYQIWHHRRLLLTIVEDPLPELTLISKILAIDAKNYHTWAYRQWILSHFDREELWKGELPFVDMLLAMDVRNNSAWHHRFFLVWDSEVRNGKSTVAEVLPRELSYVKAKIALAPNNTSAWNYLRGVLDRTETSYISLKEFVTPYSVAHPLPNDPQEDVIDLDNPLPSKEAQLPCMLAVEFMADIYEQESNPSSAVELYKKLGSELDTIRSSYWEFRAKSALK